MFKTKTKTFIFVLEAPRDPKTLVSDYVTAGPPSGSDVVLETRLSQIIPYGLETSVQKTPSCVEFLSRSSVPGVSSSYGIKTYRYSLTSIDSTQIP